MRTCAASPGRTGPLDFLQNYAADTIAGTEGAKNTQVTRFKVIPMFVKSDYRSSGAGVGVGGSGVGLGGKGGGGGTFTGSGLFVVVSSG